MTVLELDNICSGYGKTVIIRDVNLSLEQGKILCVLGRNGVGKSTLLKTIMGELSKESGEIRFEKERVNDLKPFQITKLGVAYAAQENPIFPQLTVQQNLTVGISKGRKMYLELLEDAFSVFPVLKERLNQRAGTLSGGEKKMLLMARTMIRAPKLILLDEITEGVQPSVIDRIVNALSLLKEKSGTTILLVEQNVDFAFRIADYYAVMNQGTLQDYGAVDIKLKGEIEKSLAI